MVTSAVFKIPLSFHYTGWFIGIPLLDCYNPQYMKGSLIPYHQPTEVSNTAQFMIWVIS